MAPANLICIKHASTRCIEGSSDEAIALCLSMNRRPRARAQPARTAGLSDNRRQCQRAVTMTETLAFANAAAALG
ncbi:hypothetical protein B1218_31820, partial [Pseudomonas ogarae]